MNKDNSFEIFKGIKVTEMSKVKTDSRIRDMDDKGTQFDRSPKDNVIPTQRFMDRLAKCYALKVCKEGIDIKNEFFWFEHLINAENSKIVKVSFKEAAEKFRYSSIQISEDYQYLNFKKSE